MNAFLLYLMSLLYVLAGINHFWHPKVYIRMMPAFIPAHATLVLVSGICEIVAGLLLLPRLTRPFAAWAIIALLIAVFPANVQMAIDFRNRSHPYLWAALLRLPLQGVLIWWAWQYTRIIP